MSATAWWKFVVYCIIVSICTIYSALYFIFELMKVCSLLHHWVDSHRYTSVLCLLYFIFDWFKKMETENIFFDDDKFITIIQSNSPIWDKRNEAYALKNEKEKACRNVLHAMYGEEGSEVWWKNSKNRLVHWIYYLKFKNTCKYKLEISYILNVRLENLNCIIF